MAIRSASSWGAALVLVASGVLASAGCGESESNGLPAPSAQGGCADCGGEGGAAVAPAGGVSSGSSTSAAGEAGVAEAGAPTQLAPELTLRSLSISQTLEVPLMAEGLGLPSDSRAVPLIAGKRAILRAFVDLDARYRPRPLLGALDIRAGGREHTVLSERTITQASAQDDLASTFVFDVSAEDLAADSAYRVRVLEADTSPLTRFPEAGFADFGARELGPFRLVLVPYVANGFAPKTGEEEVAALRRRLLALYPSRDVQITVASPVTLDFPVDSEDAGWDEALDSVYELRKKAAPAADVFYYGLLAPAASYDTYCASGCLLGLAYIADADDAGERGAIGVGIFPDGSGDGDAEDTAAHELGHALGRDHAPCGISDLRDTDPRWPNDAAHKNALIGVFGYDFDFARLIKPRPNKDVMSYCSPSWISDYTYAGIFERLQAIGTEGSAAASSAVQVAQTLRVARIGRSGRSRWLDPEAKLPPPRLTASVALLGAGERVLGAVPARFARIDHGRGGKVWLPEKPLRVPGAVSVDLRPFGGAVLAL